MTFLFLVHCRFRCKLFSTVRVNKVLKSSPDFDIFLLMKCYLQRLKIRRKIQSTQHVGIPLHVLLCNLIWSRRSRTLWEKVLGKYRCVGMIQSHSGFLDFIPTRSIFPYSEENLVSFSTNASVFTSIVLKNAPTLRFFPEIRTIDKS